MLARAGHIGGLGRVLGLGLGLGLGFIQDLDKGYVSMDQTAAITALAERFNLQNTLASSSTRTPMAQEQLPLVERTDDESKSFP